MKTKALLIRTSGYEIDISKFPSIDDARNEMKNEYKRLTPTEFDPDWESMSYCDENNAILYCNGEDVYVWKVYEI